jgi:hypothetical protein
MYILIEGAKLHDEVSVSVYGPFDTPEMARVYAQENSIDGYVDILIRPYKN